MGIGVTGRIATATPESQKPHARERRMGHPTAKGWREHEKTPRANAARGALENVCSAFAERFSGFRLRNRFRVGWAADRRRNDRARFLLRGPGRLWLPASFRRDARLSCGLFPGASFLFGVSGR